MCGKFVTMVFENRYDIVYDKVYCVQAFNILAIISVDSCHLFTRPPRHVIKHFILAHHIQSRQALQFREDAKEGPQQKKKKRVGVRPVWVKSKSEDGGIGMEVYYHPTTSNFLDLLCV